MYAPKPISRESVPGALAKAERYRLLNEPGEAESICLDIIAADPQNEQALISLVLALTDQIPHKPSAHTTAMSYVRQLQTEYDRVYYEGIVWERRAKARMDGGGPGAREYVYEWIVSALDCFAKAETLRPAGNDDALLRWNACVRFLQAHPQLGPSVDYEKEAILSE
jgi:hypothetical protein